MKYTVILLVLGLLSSSCRESLAELSKNMQKGREYGNNHTLGECFERSLTILNSCDSISCAGLNLGFSRGCAETSRFDAEFCATVPSKLIDAIMAMKRDCAGHKFEKACYKYMQHPVKRCFQERSSQ